MSLSSPPRTRRGRRPCMDHLGADAYIVSSDADQIWQLPWIISTTSSTRSRPLEPYLSLLKVDGKLIMMGAINEPMQFVTPVIMLGREEKSTIGTLTGSVEEAQKMLEFCKEKGLTSMIEMVNSEHNPQTIRKPMAMREGLNVFQLGVW